MSSFRAATILPLTLCLVPLFVLFMVRAFIIPGEKKTENSSFETPRKKRREESDDDISFHPPNYHERVFMDPGEQAFPFFYTTHSFMALAAVVLPIIFLAFWVEFESIQRQNEAIVMSLIYIFLVVGVMVFPAGPFIRPHPVFWRVMFGLLVLYAMFLTVLLLQTPDQARQFLKHLDGKLGVPIVLPDYATHCELTWSNVSPKLDRFVFAHFIGWAAKGLILQNRSILYSMSIIWELLELSTVYYIPNFGECWWDSLILDLLLCNSLGIEIGVRLAEYFSERTYNWGTLFSGDTWCQKFKSFCFRSALQMTPRKWEKINWEHSSKIARFLHIQAIVVLVTALDLNAFLLKLYLWIPTEHWWNAFRLIFLAMVCVPSIRQYYFYVTDERCTRLGSMTWALLVVVVLEGALSYKCAPPDIPHAPNFNKIWWAGSAIAYVLWSFVVMGDWTSKTD